MRNSIVIGVVGPCKSGKTTLVDGLNANGFNARQIAQEHSFAPEMWKIITGPNILIFLDVSYQLSIQRGQIKWKEFEYLDQQHRLRNARESSDLYIQTDELLPDDVLRRTFEFLNQLDHD
jgi:nicotinamide riboside kinase